MIRLGLRCSHRKKLTCAFSPQHGYGCRNLLTIALETSWYVPLSNTRIWSVGNDICSDDTSVAILQKLNGKSCNLLFHEKVTAKNSAHGGIHPIVSLESHQENLALLIDKALSYLPEGFHGDGRTLYLQQSQIARAKPDFISVTRGPGMRSSLTTGLDTAKGLSVAWRIPLIGVNHMQAHALTPRLVSMLDDDPTQQATPDFPFLSLLVSGGHTLLVQSEDIIKHRILAKTSDIAVGDAIDKISRSVLPPDILQSSDEIMYGRTLERFAFPRGALDHDYTAPSSREAEIARRKTQWEWSLLPPLAGSKSTAMEFSYSGLDSQVRKVCESKPEMSVEERIELARESMRAAFEHLASRVGFALRGLRLQGRNVGTVVVSGGVASNEFLKTV